MLPVNTLLQGRYLVVEQIGRGGMGAVYKATDTRLRSTVALKETLVGGDPALIKAFEREAQLLAGLRHPNMPKVSDHFIDETGQYLVMEFITGDDLGALLTRRGAPFPAVDVLRWADQLLDALEYLHSRHPPVVHRDIKPQNMKLTERGEIILLDFGLAKGAASAQTRATNTGSIFGYTPHYAPMEQIQGTGTDPRSDLYSLAATMYHLLVGHPPIDALTRAAAKINDEPDPLVAANLVNSDVPPEVGAVLLRAMSQNPARRYPNAAAMRGMLRDPSKGTGYHAAAAINTSGETTNLEQPPMVIVSGATEVQSALTSVPTVAGSVVASTGTTLVPPGAGTTAAQPASPSRGSIMKKPWFWLTAVGALALVIGLVAFGMGGFGGGAGTPTPQPTINLLIAFAETATAAQALVSPTASPVILNATMIRQTVEAELTAVVTTATAQAVQRATDLANARTLLNQTDSAGTQTAIALTPTATPPATALPTDTAAPTAQVAAQPTSTPAPTKTAGPTRTPKPTNTPGTAPTSTPGSTGSVISSGNSGSLFTGKANKGAPIDAAQGDGGSCIQGRVLASDGSTFTNFYVQVDHKGQTIPAKHFYDSGNYKVCGLGAGEWGVAVYAVNGAPTSGNEQSRHQVRLNLSGTPGEIFYVNFTGLGAAPTAVPTDTPVPPTPEPIAGPYDGQWAGRISGKTAGDQEFSGSFRFEVRNNAIYSLALDGPSCLIETYPNFPKGKLLDGNTFAFGGSPTHPTKGTDSTIEFSVNGTFSSTNKASGALNANQNGGSCIVATWSAAR